MKQKIISFFSKNEYINIIVLILTIIIGSYLFANKFGYIFPDRGREFMLPEAVLNGAVPYKDFPLIYFPLAYYINALIYKILGISINSLIISQTILCSITVVVYYYLSREFLTRSMSFLLTLFVSITCIFSVNDLFSWVMPYSFARGYGCVAVIFCIYSLVKLFKTSSIRYAYIASILTGFACSCKIEFLSLFFVLILGLFFNRKIINLSHYIKLIVCFCTFPFIMLSILFCQGVSIKDLIDAIAFGVKFSTTGVMTDFLSSAGLNPLAFQKTLIIIRDRTFEITNIILLCFIALKVKIKYLKPIITGVMTILVWKFYYNPYHMVLYWLTLPFIVIIVLLVNFKKLLNSDNLLLFLLISSILLSQREFFNLSLSLYGCFSFPLLVLSLLIIITKFLPKDICGVKVKSWVNYVLIILIGLNAFNMDAIKKRNISPIMIQTNKGNFCVTKTLDKITTELLEFVDFHTDQNATVLVLPEGNFINFFTNRKVDLRCFMMDRLYHDAYGEEKAKDMIAQTNSDYIILVNVKYGNFNRDFLYEDADSSLASKYIYENYTVVKNITQDADNYVRVLKRKDDTEFTKEK